MSSVKTAMEVLELVANPGGIGVTELARRLGKPKATVQRSLAALHEGGWIRPNAASGRRQWTVTTKVLAFSKALEPMRLLREIALPVMEELRDETRETTQLLIAEIDRIVLIDFLESPNELRTSPERGMTGPLHLGAAGKAILAALPEAEREAYIKRNQDPSSENAIADPQDLRRKLELAAARGFALGKFSAEIRSIGSAICDGTGTPIAALSISCPATRLPDDAVEALGSRVLSAAQAISERCAEQYDTVF